METFVPTGSPQEYTLSESEEEEPVVKLPKAPPMQESVVANPEPFMEDFKNLTWSVSDNPETISYCCLFGQNVVVSARIADAILSRTLITSVILYLPYPTFKILRKVNVTNAAGLSAYDVLMAVSRFYNEPIVGADLEKVKASKFQIANLVGTGQPVPRWALLGNKIRFAGFSEWKDGWMAELK